MLILVYLEETGKAFQFIKTLVINQPSTRLFSLGLFLKV